MKRILLTLMVGLMLMTGCSNKSDDNVVIQGNENQTPQITEPTYIEGMVKPTLNVMQATEAIPEELYNYICENAGYFDVTSLYSVKEDLSDVVFVNYAGEEVKLSDLKGKKVVIDAFANWCQYSQEWTKNDKDKIKEANPDIEFLQVFIDGDKEGVQEFYDEIGQEVDQKAIPTTEAIYQLSQKLGITSFPTFLFLNEDSVVQWSTSGYVSADDFQNHIDLAYGEKSVISQIDDETLKSVKRTYREVKADIKDEVVAQIDTLKETAEYPEIFDLTFYGDLGRAVRPIKVPTFDGKEFTWDDIKDKKVLLNFFVAVEDEYTYTRENAEVLNQVAQEHPEYFIINAAIQGNEKDPGEFLKETDIKFPGMTVNMNMNYSEEVQGLYSTSMMQIPSLFFLNEGGFVAGVLPDSYTLEEFKAAESIIFGETPIYMQAK